MNLTLRDWQLKLKNKSDLIVQASPVDGSDSWQDIFSIGMSYQFVNAYDIYNNITKFQIGKHNEIVCCAISNDTDKRRRGNKNINRKVILSNLEKNGIKNSNLEPIDYFLNLPSYKFVISPEGNGIDCHRHYEAIMAGCIPIMEKNVLVENKYKNLPILYTTDYTEITDEYLNNVYLSMLDKQYDFSSLFINNYDNNTQNYIKYCGNAWVNYLCLCKKNWYM
jgi:hypothetical protein